MTAQEVEEILNELKVNSRYAIRGKNKAIDKIMQLHLKAKTKVVYVNNSEIQ